MLGSLLAVLNCYLYVSHHAVDLKRTVGQRPFVAVGLMKYQASIFLLYSGIRENTLGASE